MFSFWMASCYPTEELNEPLYTEDFQQKTQLDDYIDQNFVQEYGMSIRYRYSENYLSPGQRTAATNIDAVGPMLDFIEEFWINPYLEINNGEVFFRKHVPAEVILIGGRIFNPNGTELLGTADAGARVTLVRVNDIDPTDSEWRDLQLGTIYHEFAHIIHQRYKLPDAFETITAANYTGPGSWFILDDNDALERGFVSPYATSSTNEDYAETVAFYLFDPLFVDNYLTLDEECVSETCTAQNEGKAFISNKLAAISDHYQRVTGVSLEELRSAVQERL